MPAEGVWHTFQTLDGPRLHWPLHAAEQRARQASSAISSVAQEFFGALCLGQVFLAGADGHFAFDRAYLYLCTCVRRGRDLHSVRAVGKLIPMFILMFGATL